MEPRRRNGLDAAERTANEQAARLLANVSIQAEIQKGTRKVMAKAEP
jgi:hypothetical protein